MSFSKNAVDQFVHILGVSIEEEKFTVYRKIVLLQ